MTGDLDPIHPEQAVELYLDTREPDLSEKSLENQRYRLRSFVRWCEEQEIDNMNDINGRRLHQFRVWRSKGSGEYDPVSKVTLDGILQTLRKFLEFCASIDAVEQGLREQVIMPSLQPEEETADEILDAQYAEDLLEYLDRFHYASRDHVIMVLFWHTGIRLGSLRALDVDDLDEDDDCLWIRHRPESGTPLKNGYAGERPVAVGEYYLEMLRDYIEQNRHNVTDDFGREPLITSSQGRLTEPAIRQATYKWTRPCMIQECPHDKDPETCEWMDYDKMSGCPSSLSPHAVRRGAITNRLREGTPEAVVSGRMNVARETLEQHYDKRTAREKMQTRREFMEDV